MWKICMFHIFQQSPTVCLRVDLYKRPRSTRRYLYIYIYIYIYLYIIWIVQWKKNALRVSVAGRENISPIMLAHTVTIWIRTRLQCVIAVENSTACEGHESTKRAGANNVILLPENVSRTMGLWIRITPTAFTSPLLSVSVLETFLASQVAQGNQIATWTNLDQELSFYSPPINK